MSKTFELTIQNNLKDILFVNTFTGLKNPIEKTCILSSFEIRTLTLPLDQGFDITIFGAKKPFKQFIINKSHNYRIIIKNPIAGIQTTEYITFKEDLA
jgi:hypothetical protein